MATKKSKEKSNSALKLAMEAIQKAYGQGSVMQGQKDALPGVEFRTSGCISIDKILGGGWGKGRIIELYGPNSSGKTTLALHAIAAAQANGEICAFIDAEHALDPSYAVALGVNIEELIISQPDSGEQALQITETLINSGSLGIVVIDSVAALTPQAEIDKQIGDIVPGRQAALMSQAMRKLPRACAKTSCTLIFINQIRMKLGISWGSPETTSGGEALKFYTSQRLDVRRIGGIKDGDKLIANRTRAKIVKNKLAPPFRICEFDIRYGKGIDVAADVLDLAVEAGIVEKKGAWYNYGTDRIGQGRNNVLEYLKCSPDVYKEIMEKLQ